MNRKSLATICLAALITSPAAGFDTFWHSEASRKVGDHFGFSEDAWKIMQLGNFAPEPPRTGTSSSKILAWRKNWKGGCLRSWGSPVQPESGMAKIRQPSEAYSAVRF